MKSKNKYRAWYKNSFWDVYAIDWAGEKIITAHLTNKKESIKVYPDKKMGDDVAFLQRTGLLCYDKKNNVIEVFELDILDTPKGVCLVEWWQGGFVLLDTDAKRHDIRLLVNFFSEMPRCKKIGNFYQNIELFN